MAGYGYSGYTTPTRPPAPPRVPRLQQRSTLNAAASGKPLPADPFGLVTDNNYGAYTRATPPAAAPTKAAPAAGAGLGSQSLAQVLGLAGFNGMVPGFSTDTYGRVIPPGSKGPPTVKAFDINTDPTFQETVSLAGKNDAEAQAGALKGKHDVLLNYGDPTLARSLLGDDTLAQAAAGNPTSTLHNLADQRTRNLGDLTEGLNKDNLLYSGYRITQEEQAAHDYQNALAQAAANVNSTLGGIDSNLAGVLGQNAQQRIAAEQAAYALHKGDVGAVDTSTGTGTGAAAGNDATASPPIDLSQVLGLPTGPITVPGFSTDAAGSLIPGPSGAAGNDATATARFDPLIQDALTQAAANGGGAAAGISAPATAPAAAAGNDAAAAPAIDQFDYLKALAQAAAKRRPVMA